MPKKIEVGEWFLAPKLVEKKNNVEGFPVEIVFAGPLIAYEGKQIQHIRTKDVRGRLCRVTSSILGRRASDKQVKYARRERTLREVERLNVQIIALFERDGEVFTSDEISSLSRVIMGNTPRYPVARILTSIIDNSSP